MAVKTRMSREELFDSIRVGDRVHCMVPGGLTIVREGKSARTVREYNERSGKVAIAPNLSGDIDHWVLNMGGKHGIPQVATREIITKVRGIPVPKE